MSPVDNHRAIAQELVSLAHQQGIDLEPLRIDFTFQKDHRWIDVWRKDQSPSSGPANVKEGTLLYSMQGAIAVLPSKLKNSASVFRGSWFERGSFEDLEQALTLLKAWLLDEKEVDELPPRFVRAYGI